MRVEHRGAAYFGVHRIVSTIASESVRNQEAVPTSSPESNGSIVGDAANLSPEAAGDVRDTRGRGWSAVFRGLYLWFAKTSNVYSDAEVANQYAVDWVRMIPYACLHLACLGVIWVGWSPIAVAVAAGLYVVHMFSVTAFYHRYFSHRTYQTSRFFQFIFAVLGASCVQRGPIWWAARHRHHHRNSDQEDDVHSPIRHGLYWSHVGWITSKRAFGYDQKSVVDLLKYPELRFIDRFDSLVPLLEAIGLFGLGKLLQAYGFNTSGWQMLIWGFFISTVVCAHATFTINSLTHLWGRKRYNTGDESRNSLLLALITFGEGWHNNHHYYPGSVRQGFYWWEIDLTYYVLYLMSRLGIIWDLNGVPKSKRESHRVDAVPA